MSPRQSRRTALKHCAAGAIAAGTALATTSAPAQTPTSTNARPWIAVRGIYGGFPSQILDRGESLAEYGVNAIWVGSGGLKAEQIDRYHKLGVQVFAEFNSMHAAQYLKESPDAAPTGPDGQPSPPPNGWQGVSPFHAGYRREREEKRIVSLHHHHSNCPRGRTAGLSTPRP